MMWKSVAAGGAPVSRPALSPGVKAAALSAVMGLSEAKAKNCLEIILQESETLPQEPFIQALTKYGVSFIKGT